MSGQTGRILGTIAGAVLGYFTGGASYIAIGATLGGAVGSLLDPKQVIEGPRIDDVKVQVSTYGIGIPRLSGTERFGGNVIWSTDKLEIATEVEAGKGGGGVVNKSYAYYVHMSLLLCETPRDGSDVNIVKIFQDGKLIWDASSGIPVGSALASAENPYSSFVLFQGHQDQLPDPIEESWTGGPGTCSAYRGVVRIRMLAIECPGGRVPQFSFVLTTSGTVQDDVATFTAVPAVTDNRFSGAVKSSSAWHYSIESLGFGNGLRLHYYYAEAGSITKLGAIDLPEHTASAVPFPLDGATDPLLMFPHVDGGTNVALDVINLRKATVTRLYEEIGLPSTVPGFNKGRGAYEEAQGIYAVLSILPDDTQRPRLIDLSGLATEVDRGTGVPFLIGITLQAVHMVSSDSGTLVYERRTMDGDASAIWPATIGPALSGLSYDFSMLHCSEDGVYALIVYSGSSAFAIYKINPATLTDPGSWQLLSSNPSPQSLGQTIFFSTRSFFANDQTAIYGPVNNLNEYLFVRFDALLTSEVKVKDIIAAECVLAGSTTYDVSGIPDSDTVYGYKRANPASARANIEPLLTLIGGFVVDEDGVTKFKKYADITSVASVSFEELGQAEAGSDLADAMPLNRTQEIDLPRSVTTNYIEPTNDFQTAAETFVRQVTDATEDMQIQLALCIRSDQAQKVSQMAAMDKWRRQNTRSAVVSRKFAFVSPGDGVTIEYPRGTFKLWLLLATNDTGVVCEWSVCPGDASIFTQTAIGATGYTGQQVSPIAPQTRMLLLDSPIMRDQDNNAGLYVAGEGFASTGWRGYTLWVGDDDSNLQDRGTVTTPCPIGYAESALGAWTPNMIDGRNSVVVNMGDDELSSTTNALLMTSRANLALIGDNGRWEAIQFQTASSLGGGRYLIYSLLRGQFGTERFRGTHQAGDQFVLITPNAMLRPSQDIGSIGSTRSYRPVSLGRSFDSAPSVTFANTAVGLLPYSPWDARKSKAASNDQTITWQRRSRLSTNALRGTVPLGENSESYSIEFYTSSAFTTLAGTLTSSTKTLTITSAQQTAFGLTPGGTLYLHIRQVSDAVGAGAPLEATL